MKIVATFKKSDEGNHSDDKQAQNSEPNSKLPKAGAQSKKEEKTYLSLESWLKLPWMLLESLKGFAHQN